MAFLQENKAVLLLLMLCLLAIVFKSQIDFYLLAILPGETVSQVQAGRIVDVTQKPDISLIADKTDISLIGLMLAFFIFTSIRLIQYFYSQKTNAKSSITTTIKIERDPIPEPSITETLQLTQKISVADVSTPKNTKQPKKTNTSDIVKTIVANVDKKPIKTESNPFESPAAKKWKPGMCIGAGNRYRLDKALAEGGAGVLYKGYDTKLNRVVALKQLLPHLEAVGSNKKRFVEEAQSLAKLNSPFVVQIYDIIDSAGCWLVMEFLPNGDLMGLMEREKTIALPKAKEIVLDVLMGLKEAHSAGFVHRDVKPHNILFADDMRSKLTDFGIAKREQSSVKTTVGMILGSPAYISPEQACGQEVTYLSDIYSLGITFYQMLIGELPFNGDAMAVLNQHINADLPSLGEYESHPIAGVIKKMTAKKANERPTDVGELISVIEGL